MWYEPSTTDCALSGASASWIFCHSAWPEISGHFSGQLRPHTRGACSVFPHRRAQLSPAQAGFTRPPHSRPVVSRSSVGPVPIHYPLVSRSLAEDGGVTMSRSPSSLGRYERSWHTDARAWGQSVPLCRFENQHAEARVGSAR